MRSAWVVGVRVDGLCGPHLGEGEECLAVHLLLPQLVRHLPGHGGEGGPETGGLGDQWEDGSEDKN